MGVGASSTASALISNNDPRRGSILAHILLGRKLPGCGHAGKCVNVDDIPVSAMPNCETALEADWMSNLLFRSSDGRHCHLSTSQIEKMGPCHFA